MSAHAAAWTAARRIADRLIGRTSPGKHHPIWDVPTPVSPLTSIYSLEDFDSTAARMFGAAA